MCKLLLLEGIVLIILLEGGDTCYIHQFLEEVVIVSQSLHIEVVLEAIEVLLFPAHLVLYEVEERIIEAEALWQVVLLKLHWYAHFLTLADLKYEQLLDQFDLSEYELQVHAPPEARACLEILHEG